MLSLRTETELLAEIRKERYVELCYEGHRWFDLRRYGMPSISHDYKARPNLSWVTYTLREKDPLYRCHFRQPCSRIIFNWNKTLLPGSRKEREKLNRTKIQKNDEKNSKVLEVYWDSWVCLVCSEDKKIGGWNR